MLLTTPLSGSRDGVGVCVREGVRSAPGGPPSAGEAACEVVAPADRLGVAAALGVAVPLGVGALEDVRLALCVPVPVGDPVSETLPVTLGLRAWLRVTLAVGDPDGLGVDTPEAVGLALRVAVPDGDPVCERLPEPLGLSVRLGVATCEMVPEMCWLAV